MVVINDFDQKFPPKGEGALNGVGGYESIQNMVGEASSGDIIHVGPGTFSENVLVDTARISIIGAGPGTVVGGGDSHAIRATADGVTVANLSVRTTSGGGNTAHGLFMGDSSSEDQTATNIWVEASDSDGVRFGGGSGHLAAGIRNPSLTGVTDTIDDAFLRMAGSGVVDTVVGTLSMTTGVVADNGSEILLSNIKVTAFGDDGIILAGGGAHSLTGFDVGSFTTSLQVKSDASDNKIDNGILSSDLVVESGAQRTRIGENVTVGNVSGSLNDSGTETIQGGRYPNPPTQDLGGSNGSISPTDNGLTHYDLLVDAGGSASDLQGIDAITEVGTVVVLQRTGGETVTLAHQNGSASNPLSNLGGGNVDLGSNNDAVAYQKTPNQWDMLWQDTGN